MRDGPPGPPGGGEAVAARMGSAALEDGVPGRIHISGAVVAKVAARAALDLPDVGAAAPRVLGHTLLGAGRLGIPGSDLAGLPRTSADVDGDKAFVEMTISVRWPEPVASVTSSLCEHVRERVYELTELTVADIRITVADLVTEAASVRRVR